MILIFTTSFIMAGWLAAMPASAAAGGSFFIFPEFQTQHHDSKNSQNGDEYHQKML